MKPLWSGEPREAAEDPQPPRRHARLYEAEYAKQLRRIERIRKSVSGGETPAQPHRTHRSWDEPPAPAPRSRPPEEETRPAGDPRSLSHADQAEPAAEPHRRRTDVPDQEATLDDAGEVADDAPMHEDMAGDAGAETAPRADELRRVVRLRSIEPRPDVRVSNGWMPPRPEHTISSSDERPKVALFASGLGLLGVAALAIALLVARDGGPRPQLLPLPAPATDLVAGSGRLWAAAPQAGSVWILDDESADPLAPAIKTGGTPARLAVAGNRGWAADTEHGALVRLQRGRASAPLRLGPDVADVALAGGAVWAASAADGMLRALPDGARRPRVLPVGGHPVALAADESSVVVASADGSVTWFDAQDRRRVAAIRVGGTPIAVAMDGGAAWIADARRGTVQRVAAGGGGRISAGPPIEVGDAPVALAARDGQIYVACRGDRTLRVVDAREGKVTKTVDLGIEPAAVAVDGEYVWVAAAGKSALARIERRRLL